MAEIQQKLLKKLFQLSGLKAPEKETEMAAVAADLKEILSHFQKIKEIDTEGVKPLVNPLEQTEQNLRMREDKAVSFEATEEELLNRTSNREGKLIKAPRVV